LTRWWWRLWQQRPVDGIVVTTGLLSTTIVLAAIGLRAVDPDPLVVIAPFETPAFESDGPAITGRSFANLLGEEFRQVTWDAREFRRSRLLATNDPSPLDVAVPPVGELDVQTPSAGLSPEWFKTLWSRFRRRRTVIEGDLVVGADGLSVHTRTSGRGGWVVNQEGSAPMTMGALDAVIGEVATRILADLRPEIVGAHLVAEGNHGRAIEVYRDWVRREPRSLEAWFELGYAHYMGGVGAFGDTAMVQAHAAKAACAFRRVLDREPDHYPALVGLGAVLALQGLPEDVVVDQPAVREAIATYERALDVDPEQVANGEVVKEVHRLRQEAGCPGDETCSPGRERAPRCGAGIP
jgi:tetratricopeptide repeat protein